MNKKKLMAFGGCHVCGYGADGNPSFVDIVEKKFNLQIVNEKIITPLREIYKLNSSLLQFCPDLIILQLGNYEFNRSLKKLFVLDYFSKSKIPSSLVESSTYNGFPQRSKLLNAIIDCLSPFKFIVGFIKNRKFLSILKKTIEKNPNSIFVVISPLPTYINSGSRKIGTYYFKVLFEKMPNVVFIDSFKAISAKKEHFYDLIHLNSAGHQLLGEAISSKLKDKLL